VPITPTATIPTVTAFTPPTVNQPIAATPLPTNVTTTPDGTPLNAPVNVNSPSAQQQRLIEASNERDANRRHELMTKIISDPNTSKENKDLAMKLAAEANERDLQAQKASQELKKATPNDLVRAMRSNSDEGSYIKLALFHALGWNQLAQQEQIKLGHNLVRQGAEDRQGNGYTVERNPVTGDISRVWDQKGVEQGPDKIAELMATGMKPGTKTTSQEGTILTSPSTGRQFILQRSNVPNEPPKFVPVGGGAPISAAEQAELGKLGAMQEQEKRNQALADTTFKQEYERLSQQNQKDSQIPGKPLMSTAEMIQRAEQARQAILNLHPVSHAAGVAESRANPNEVLAARQAGQSLTEYYNNPGAIFGADGRIRRFATPEEGRRALENDLSLKIGGQSAAFANKWGSGTPVTPYRLAETWAPANAVGNTPEGTKNYGEFIAKSLGIGPNDVIVNTPENITKTANAITQFESGHYKPGPTGPVMTIGSTVSGPNTQEPIVKDAEFFKNPDNWDQWRPKGIKGVPADTDKTYAERQKLLAQLPTLQSSAEKIARYEEPAPSMGRGNPANAAMMEMVHKINPDFNATNYEIAKRTRLSFATGKDADKLDSHMTVIKHEDTLLNLIDNLNNTQSPLFNKYANEWSYQTGKAPPVTFDAAKQLVGDEIAKAATGGRSALGDREEIKAVLNRANTPDQLKSVVEALQELQGGQLTTLRDRWTRAGLPADQFNDFLDEPTRAALERADRTAKQNFQRRGQKTQQHTESNWNE